MMCIILKFRLLKERTTCPINQKIPVSVLTLAAVMEIAKPALSIIQKAVPEQTAEKTEKKKSKKEFFMKKLFLGIVCICILLAGCQPSNVVEVQMFGNFNMICVVVNNTVRFYEFNANNSKWEEDKSMLFNLPDNYSNVFGYYGSLCVVTENTVRFYSFDDYDYFGNRLGRNNWEEIESDKFIIPDDGYRDIFAIFSWLGVVVEDAVRFYEFSDYDDWRLYSRSAFNLPDNNSFAFGLSSMMGVGSESTVRFYDFVDFGRTIWEEDESMLFNLPENYKNIIVTEFLDIYIELVGVVDGKTVRFYGFDYSNNQWEEHKSREFSFK